MLSWISGTTFTTENYTRQCSLSGYLLKMKRHRKLLVPQWNRRWFSIEGKFLKWYETSTSEESSGSIDLKRVSYISRFEMQGAYSFIIGYPDRNLMIRAETLECMDKWIRALQLQADIARGGNGMNIITNSGPSSPSARSRTAAKKKSSSLEAELDRSLRQLQELERKILNNPDEMNYNSYSNLNRIIAKPMAQAAGKSVSETSSTWSDHSLSEQSHNQQGISSTIQSNIRVSTQQRKPSRETNSNQSSHRKAASRDAKEDAGFSYSDAYPRLDDDAPKTNDILVDVVDKSIYTSLTRGSSRSSRKTSMNAAHSSADDNDLLMEDMTIQDNPMVISGKSNKPIHIPRNDSSDSIEEIVDRPVRRINSKTRSRNSSIEDAASNRSVATAVSSSVNSGRIPPSHPSSRQSSRPNSRQTSYNSAAVGYSGSSGFTTEEDQFSGRSGGSQSSPRPIPYRHVNDPTASAKKLNTNYSYDPKTDLEEIQEVQLHVRQGSRRLSKGLINGSSSGRLSSNFENNAW